jgi:hypothetical protein
MCAMSGVMAQVQRTVARTTPASRPLAGLVDRDPWSVHAGASTYMHVPAVDLARYCRYGEPS